MVQKRTYILPQTDLSNWKQGAERRGHGCAEMALKEGPYMRRYDFIIFIFLGGAAAWPIGRERSSWRDTPPQSFSP